MKKMITVAMPCRNEEDNIERMVSDIEYQFKAYLSDYDYKIQFMDNDSTDATREIIKRLASENEHICAIFNISNFACSSYHGILQAQGDCCIFMASDCQEPPSLIPALVAEWERGARVVCAIKTSSQENKRMWRVRSLYYKLIRNLSAIDQIDHFTGFGLYSREFIEVMRSLNDSIPTLRGVVAEYGYDLAFVPYEQVERIQGESKQNFLSLFDYAMNNITTYTKSMVHVALVLGLAMSLVGLVGFIGSAIWCIVAGPVLLNCAILVVAALLCVGGLVLAAVSFVGEYVVKINTRVLRKPYAIEKERLGFDRLPLPERVQMYNPSQDRFEDQSLNVVK